MEGSDAFGQGVEIGESEDPFAGTDFGDFGDEPAGPVASEPTGELKTVDKEGNEVPPDAPAHAPADAASVESQEGQAAVPPPTPVAEPAVQSAEDVAANTQPSAGGVPRLTPEQAKEEARRYREEHGEGEYAPQKVQERLRAIAEREAAEKAAREAHDDVPPPEPVGEPEGDPTPPSSDDSPTASVSEPSSPPGTDEPELDSEEEQAPEPEETTDSSGKTTKRKYYILRPTGPGKFEQVSWYEKDGKIVAKGTTGAKRQAVALARGAEDALKIGFVASGAPQDGITLVAVAALHFQPKPIKPRPPEPSRVRLQIG